MKKAKILLVVFALLVMPNFVFADDLESNFKCVTSVTKYYKTITNYNNLKNFDLVNNSVTFEISESEYNSALINNDAKSATVETTYKKLVSSIYQNGSYYRYKAELTWKNMPKVRSYDIIGIGFHQSVKVHNNLLFFSQYFCKSDGTCITSSANSPQIFNGGAGTSFILPSGSLTTLKETLYFDVEKNTNATITSQLAASDYAHATSSISSTNAQNYTVSSSGITLNGISSYYDYMNSANATWSGSW